METINDLVREGALFDYLTRKINDDIGAPMLDINVCYEPNERVKEVHVAIDPDRLMAWVLEKIYKELKHDGIAYPKLRMHVPEKGIDYKLTWRSENRPDGYKAIK